MNSETNPVVGAGIGGGAGRQSLSEPRHQGALVGRHPCAEFRMFGIGSNAGGPDYLDQFVIPVNITENTLRRGFAPPSAEE